MRLLGVRNFLLGVVTTLFVVVLGVGALVLSVRTDSPSGTTDQGTTPTSSASTAPRPTSVAKGETWLGVVDFNSSEVLTDGGGFVDVDAKGSGVTVSDKGIRADRLDLIATLPWAAAASQVGDGVELYAAGSGQAGLSRTVELLGQKVPVKAAGVVRAEAGLLVIEPKTIDLQGPDWLDSVASAAARSLVTIRQPVQGVPAGMQLTDVKVIPDGFRATLTGTNVTITN